jgi:hypothetical protein
VPLDILVAHLGGSGELASAVLAPTSAQQLIEHELWGTAGDTSAWLCAVRWVSMAIVCSVGLQNAVTAGDSPLPLPSCCFVRNRCRGSSVARGMLHTGVIAVTLWSAVLQVENLEITPRHWQMFAAAPPAPEASQRCSWQHSRYTVCLLHHPHKAAHISLLVQRLCIPTSW